MLEQKPRNPLATTASLPVAPRAASFPEAPPEWPAAPDKSAWGSALASGDPGLGPEAHPAAGARAEQVLAAEAATAARMVEWRATSALGRAGLCFK